MTYNFQKLLYWKRRFPQVQFLLLITFKSDSLRWYALHWYGQKVYHVDDHYARYGINFMVTPKALCLLLGPNESRDTQCFDNWWTLQPMEHTITAAEYAPVLHNKHIREFNLQLFIVTVCMVMVYKFAE